jgi:hypothetical protein
MRQYRVIYFVQDQWSRAELVKKEPSITNEFTFSLLAL